MLRKLLPKNRDFVRTCDLRGEDAPPSNLVLSLALARSLPSRRIKLFEERLNLRIGLIDKGEDTDAFESLALPGERSFGESLLSLSRGCTTAARTADSELVVDGALLVRIHH